MSSTLFQSGNLVIRACRHGPMAYLVNDQIIGRSFEVYGEYAEEEMKLLAQVLHPGDTFLDIGANIGAHTIAMSKLVGSKGKVFSFEPQRMIHAILCTNIAINNLTNVRAQWQAVGAKAGTVVLPMIDYAKPDNFGGISLNAEGRGEAVRLGRIDDLDLPECRLIKIDVEGMEEAVLIGARETIGRHRPVLYVEADRPDNYQRLLQQLFGMEYRIWLHPAPLFHGANFFNVAEDIFGSMISLNAFCVPAEQRVEVPLFEAKTARDGLDVLCQAMGVPMPS